ncbi:putative leucine-rich repeat-containing protein DDB_G0290503 [Battus philenor]|uniref:putative leucine-rich repeat-containing protein DDB_G0290503 n=1 Tax=Battus philenor TaxID=42288 RepID=UPI0035D09648
MSDIVTDHSDSDSGDSWTILEPTSEYTENVLEFPKDPNERLHNVCNENDEDTDGISIISDSEHESPTPCKHTLGTLLTEDKIMLEDQKDTHSPRPTLQITNCDDTMNFNTAIRADNDFLTEGNGKLKTYVHRRNKRLSTVLNIIMLGSVITAAGVAIGHMWGAKNDCNMHHTPSVNKILSNLYKLQEENAYLRNKLKELTLMSNLQLRHHKMLAQKQACKKVFEEPLNSKITGKVTKCIDNKNIEYDKLLESHLEEPLFEKEFVSEINKLKNIYQQNKSWLDQEIAKRLKSEDQHIKSMKNMEIAAEAKTIYAEEKSLTPEIPKLPQNDLNDDFDLQQITFSKFSGMNEKDLQLNKKISYADSLKSELKTKNTQKREIDKKQINEYSEHIKKKVKKSNAPNIHGVVSEEEIKKDDRYHCNKCKYNNKKSDKWRKKQKRRDKYEQLDIKNRIKDYDSFEVSQQNEDIERANKDNRESNKHDILKGNVTKSKQKNDSSSGNGDKGNWFERRATLRNEYRNKLEQELFGEKSINNSGWYFRRMKRREQCRAKTNNSTHKKPKLNMNFKMKY